VQAWAGLSSQNPGSVFCDSQDVCKPGAELRQRALEAAAMSETFSTELIPAADRIEAWEWNARRFSGDCRFHFPSRRRFHEILPLVEIQHRIGQACVEASGNRFDGRKRIV